MATESRLAPVPGPVPHSYPLCKELQLPGAFTSSATHFTPIILTNEGDEEEGSVPLGTATEGTSDEFIKTIDPIAESSCSFPPPSDCVPIPTQPSQQTHQLAAGPTVAATSTTASSTKLENFPSTFSDGSCIRPSSTNLNGCRVFNNYLFRQDPTTGQLSLVPVRVRAPESQLGLDINLSLVPRPLQELMAVPKSDDDLCIDCSDLPSPPGAQERVSPSSYFCAMSDAPDSPLKPTAPRVCKAQTNLKAQSEDRSVSTPAPRKVHPTLQEVIDLLKGNFSLNSHGRCLDRAQEDMAMGEYIFSLKDIQYQTFASIVKERFSDLYWEENLLGVLHFLVNYSPSALDSNEQTPSKAVKRATLSPPFTATVCTRKRELSLLCCLDLNGNIHTPSPVAAGCWERTEARSCHGENQAGFQDAELGSTDRRPRESRGVNADSLDSEVMEGGDHSAGGSDENPSEAEFPSGNEPGLKDAHDEQMSPDFSEDMQDNESLLSERLLSPRPRAGSTGPGFRPAWDSAFYEEDCFSPEVMEYALSLGRHTGSPSLDVKTQELQQQLIIETRNLKKTRNFYQKLIQQERKNKGSESKLILSKLKSQLEELRSKVAFLDCVKKYLEILSVDQWGLEVSLLPSLAVSGRDSCDLECSEDPSVLNFGPSKEKSSLLAGSPQGLMAYLYARNAAMEGYIQQFLYTYRFFCTPEQLLQFIMDKFISAAREGPDLSGYGERIFHRSLDLLRLWITDYKLVDFAPKSSLVNTLENFLNTEVIPADSQGEALLDALHRRPSTTTSGHVRGILINFEEDDSLCLHSSTEDLNKKWQISRLVDPSASMSKEKAYSISAALPAPCYGSLMHDLSNICPQSEERLPFSQNEYSAQHIAQQLTLLQQEIFQGCHPVHFLNSRVQGVGDKVLSLNKNASQQTPPAESSVQLVREETPSDSCLQRLLTYADSVTNWISAEIVICDSVKTQAVLLTKYLWIGKHCYESRNFATAMQILGGLENVIVRQLAAWKHLASKVFEILEELRAVQVFLKSDDLCLMGGQHKRKRPTLPSAHILAMHVQQLEIGAFTLTSGAYKWTKLRSIAKVVSQVHAFQEALYPYNPDQDLQAYLRCRIAQLANSDVHLLAADNDANFQQSSERQTRRIHSTLRRVKATFQ